MTISMFRKSPADFLLLKHKILSYGVFTPTSFGSDFQTFQFDPDQTYRSEASAGPRSGPKSWTSLVPYDWIKNVAKN